MRERREVVSPDSVSTWPSTAGPVSVRERNGGAARSYNALSARIEHDVVKFCVVIFRKDVSPVIETCE